MQTGNRFAPLSNTLYCCFCSQRNKSKRRVANHWQAPPAEEEEETDEGDPVLQINDFSIGSTEVLEPRKEGETQRGEEGQEETQDNGWESYWSKDDS